MNRVESAHVGCPYCGEQIEILVDLSEGGQDYIEDCQVCCRPIQMRVSAHADGDPVVDARHEDEV